MRYFTALAAFVCCAALVHGDNWPAWRGPTGQGVSAERQLPLTWSTTDNIRWKVPLPDAGNSTPVVWGDRVFITQASEKTTWPPSNAGGPAVAGRRSLL